MPAGLIIAGVTSRALSLENYGQYSLVAAIVGGAEWLITAYNSRATQMLSDPFKRPSYFPTIFRQYLYVSLILMAALMLFSLPLAAWFQSDGLAPYLILLSLDLPLFALNQVQRCGLNSEGEFGLRAGASVARWVTRAAATWLLLAAGWDVSGALAAWLLASLAEILAVRRLPLRLLSQAGAPFGVVWREGRTLLACNCGSRLYERLDLFLLQAFTADARLTGLYSAAQTLAILPGLFTAALSGVLSSVIVRGSAVAEGTPPVLSRADRDTGLRGLRAAICLLPLAVIFALNGQDLAEFAFGHRFRAAGDFLGPLSMAAIGLALSRIASGILGAIGLARYAWWLSIPSCAVLAGLLWFTIPAYGATGAAATTASVSVVNGLLAGVFVCRQLERQFPWVSLLRVIAASLIVGALCAWPPFATLWLPLGMALACAAGLGLLIALGEWTVSEVRGLLGVR